IQRSAPTATAVSGSGLVAAELGLHAQRAWSGGEMDEARANTFVADAHFDLVRAGAELEDLTGLVGSAIDHRLPRRDADGDGHLLVELAVEVAALARREVDDAHPIAVVARLGATNRVEAWRDLDGFHGGRAAARRVVDADVAPRPDAHDEHRGP